MSTTTTTTTTPETVKEAAKSAALKLEREAGKGLSISIEEIEESDDSVLVIWEVSLDVSNGPSPWGDYVYLASIYATEVIVVGQNYRADTEFVGHDGDEPLGPETCFESEASGSDLSEVLGEAMANAVYDIDCLVWV